MFHLPVVHSVHTQPEQGKGSLESCPSYLVFFYRYHDRYHSDRFCLAEIHRQFLCWDSGRNKPDHRPGHHHQFLDRRAAGPALVNDLRPKAAMEWRRSEPLPYLGERDG